MITEVPNKKNTLLDESQVVYNPVYAKPSTLGQLFNISKASVYRILKEYDANSNGIENLYVSLSSTLTLVNIERFAEYLQTRHRKWT